MIKGNHYVVNKQKSHHSRRDIWHLRTELDFYGYREDGKNHSGTLAIFLPFLLCICL